VGENSQSLEKYHILDTEDIRRQRITYEIVEEGVRLKSLHEKTNKKE